MMGLHWDEKKIKDYRIWIVKIQRLNMQPL